ncbi:hypothetical protein [Paenibacillus hexagrammi]|uniref:Uncharacterized protein n=1 Tax=Paenibacillus hexagrammi TaxID=2908839 RepID=A0ABY3SIN4_9BACL|nr:hypothetical protein [Paenibacillus sp. YPD9-1]UJF33084.1 hypothetical protein L0M14_26545 [Paenibacillus sp. YPD9-1]
MVWSHWSSDRVIIFMIGLFYILLWAQVTMFHYRQNFHSKVMWAPVLLAPLICLVSIISTLANTSGWFGLTQVLFWLGAISGLIGFYYHVKGVGKRVGGYAFRNFLIGPPIMLPLLFSGLSILGLIAVYGG